MKCEYLDGKLWNMKEYDKSNNLINELINGKGLIKKYNYHLNYYIGSLESECEYWNGDKIERQKNIMIIMN